MATVEHWHPSLTVGGTTHIHADGDHYHFHMDDLADFLDADKLTAEQFAEAASSRWRYQPTKQGPIFKHPDEVPEEPQS